jgi:hypothetical protein
LRRKCNRSYCSVIKSNENKPVALGVIFILNSVAVLFPQWSLFDLSQREFYGAIAIHDTSSVVEQRVIWHRSPANSHNRKISPLMDYSCSIDYGIYFKNKSGKLKIYTLLDGLFWMIANLFARNEI